MTNVTKVGFILEVRAENERDLGDKLYGYDDLEAERALAGFDPHNDDIDWELCRDELARQGHTMNNARELQEEQETVNDLLRNARFDGHGVLFKTDGTNLSGRDGPSEIPHFGHSVTCDDHEECENNSSENYYRMFSSADLIIEGNANADILGDYKLRDDVLVSLSGINGEPPEPGEEPAERV